MGEVMFYTTTQQYSSWSNREINYVCGTGMKLKSKFIRKDPTNQRKILADFVFCD